MEVVQRRSFIVDLSKEGGGIMGGYVGDSLVGDVGRVLRLAHGGGRRATRL